MEQTVRHHEGEASGKSRWVEGFLASLTLYSAQIRSAALSEPVTGCEFRQSVLHTIRGFANYAVAGYEQEVDKNLLDPTNSSDSHPSRGITADLRKTRMERIQMLRESLQTVFNPYRRELVKDLLDMASEVQNLDVDLLLDARLFGPNEANRLDDKAPDLGRISIESDRTNVQSTKTVATTMLHTLLDAVRLEKAAKGNIPGTNESIPTQPQPDADPQPTAPAESHPKQALSAGNKRMAWWISYSLGTLLFVLHGVLAFSVLLKPHTQRATHRQSVNAEDPTAAEIHMNAAPPAASHSPTPWKNIAVYAIMVCMMLLVVFERLRQALWYGRRPPKEVCRKQKLMELVLHVAMMVMIVLGCIWHYMAEPTFPVLEECSLEIVSSISLTLMSHLFGEIILHEDSIAPITE